MNSSITVKRKITPPASPQKVNGAADKEIYYPESDKKVLGETDYHSQQIRLLSGLFEQFFESRADVYISSDIFVYYEEGNPRRRFAPDVMVCFGLENQKRRSYKLWVEQVVPSVIIEIASNETWEKDVTTKRRLYEQLGVSEFYIFDAEYKYLPQPLMAYRLEFGELVRQAIADNRIFSPALDLELVNTGEMLRLFNPETNKFLPTPLELKRTEETIMAENERLKAEIERLKNLQK